MLEDGKSPEGFWWEMFRLSAYLRNSFQERSFPSNIKSCHVVVS